MFYRMCKIFYDTTFSCTFPTYKNDMCCSPVINGFLVVVRMNVAAMDMLYSTIRDYKKQNCCIRNVLEFAFTYFKLRQRKDTVVTPGSKVSYVLDSK